MLSQLVYVSNRKQSCSEQEIEKILESCKKNNPPLNITGVLLYSDTRFIQLVEGDAKLLGTLYDKIKSDSRHDQVRMISYGPIKQKAFPSWHMGAKKLSDTGVNFRTDISSEDKAIFESLLQGKEQAGAKVLDLLQKFFR
jgi:hypothetical protein